MTENSRLDYPDSIEAASLALREATQEDYASGRVEHLLDAAAKSGETDWTRIERFIRDHLLPLCLSEPLEGDKRVIKSRLRRLLSSWLSSLPDETLWLVRARVLEDVLAETARKPTLSALYCLAAIGYRSAAVVRALREVGGLGEQLGHEALRLLVGMEPSNEDRDWIADRIENTPPHERTDELLSAAALLHDRQWLGMLTESAAESTYPMFALSRIAWLGENAPGDLPLQNAVWSAGTRCCERGFGSGNRLVRYWRDRGSVPHAECDRVTGRLSGEDSSGHDYPSNTMGGAGSRGDFTRTTRGVALGGAGSLGPRLSAVSGGKQRTRNRWTDIRGLCQGDCPRHVALLAQSRRSRHGRTRFAS